MIARTESLPVLGPRVVNRLPMSALARLFAAADDGHCGILARTSAQNSCAFVGNLYNARESVPFPGLTLSKHEVVFEQRPNRYDAVPFKGSVQHDSD